MPDLDALAALATTLTWLDGIGLALLLGAWFALGWWIDHPAAARPSVTQLMAQFRRDWMQRFAERDNRIFDAQIIGNLRQATNFFASTCLIAIGGVLALMGNTAPLTDIAEELTMDHPPDLVWQLRLMPVILFLATAFLRFVWSSRVFGYCSVVMGSVPNDPADPDVAPRITQAAELNIRAAVNFNRGLRAMYFALASIAWLLGGAALIVATVAAARVVWVREFASIPRDILTEGR